MGLKVLVISAHVDDAECGCGGTIARHVENGDHIEWHTLISKGYRVPDGWKEDILKDEFKEAMEVLGVHKHKLHNYPVDTIERRSGIRNVLYKLWHKYEPDVAYIPWRGSRHQDHKIVGQCAYEISWKSVADIFAYVVPNDYLGFVPNVFSLVDRVNYAIKMNVIGCYKSQYELRPWFQDSLIDNFSKAFAVFANGTDAHVEPFQQVKRLLM